MTKIVCRPRVFRSRGGFTLIELMIVVAIVGVLASLAVPAFRTVMMRAKTAEVGPNLNAMFKNAASYYAAERAGKGHTATARKHCTVADVGPLPASPSAHKHRVPSNDPGFAAIGFSVAEYSYFSYGLATETGTGGCGHAINDATVYTLYAQGDLDGDTATSSFEMAVGSDPDNQLYHARGLYIQNELE